MSGDGVRRAHVEIVGRVQGVGFRWFVRERARALGVAGWVSNRDDGAVEVLAEGPATSVARLLDDLRQGPSGAYVTAVHELPDDGAPAPKPFSVER